MEEFCEIDLRFFIRDGSFLCFNLHFILVDKPKHFLVEYESLVFRVPFKNVVKNAEVDDPHVGAFDWVYECCVLIRTESDVVHIDSYFP